MDLDDMNYEVGAMYLGCSPHPITVIYGILTKAKGIMQFRLITALGDCYKLGAVANTYHTTFYRPF